MAFALTADMRAVVKAAHLAFAATVSADGRPNLSPKGTIRVYDDHHLCFLDIASPRTRANLEQRPWMEINVVDALSRRGYRFAGPAKSHAPSSAEFARASEILRRDDSNAYPALGVVVLAVVEAAPVRSPGYRFVRDEADMRAAWRKRRDALDAEFDEFLLRARP